MLGNSVMEKLNQKLTALAPKASKNPEELINRFEKLLEKYVLFPTADKWPDDRKLRLIWRACSKYKALQMKVEMIKSEYTSRYRPVDRLT